VRGRTKEDKKNEDNEKDYAFRSGLRSARRLHQGN